MLLPWIVACSAFVGLLGLGFAGSAEAQQGVSSMEIRLESDRATYRMGEPVTLRLTLINASSHAIRMRPSTPSGAAKLVVLDAHGKKVEPNLWPSFHFAGGPHITVQPGEHLPVRGINGETISLTEWGYDLREPGKYTIVAIPPGLPAEAAVQSAATAPTSSQVVLTIAR
jgi:hypothetical protein